MEEVNGLRLYCCSNCRNHVALHDDVISKAFQVNTILSQFYLLFTAYPAIMIISHDIIRFLKELQLAFYSFFFNV